MEGETGIRELLQWPRHTLRLNSEKGMSDLGPSQEEDFLDNIRKELEGQRKTLSSLFASESSQSEEAYLRSLPKDPKRIRKHSGIILTPIIVEPRVLLPIVAEKTEFDIKCEPSHIQNWEEGKVVTRKYPYIAWLAVDRGRRLQEAIDEYRKNPFFRGITVLEAVFASLFVRNLLNLNDKIYTLGSRISTEEDLPLIPSISKNSEGKKEIENPDLLLDNPTSLNTHPILIAAR